MFARPRGLLVIALSVLAPALVAAQELRYKFQPGTATSYTIEQKQSMKATGSGQELDSKFNSTFEFTLKVDSVDAGSGKAKLKVKFDRVRMAVQGTPMDDFAVDSQSDKTPDVRLAGKLMPLLKAVVAADITLSATPRGEVSEVTLPEKLREEFQKLADEGGGMSGLFSEDQLRMILNDPVMLLPKEAVTTGTTWPLKQELKMGQLGTMKLDTTCTYAGKAGPHDKIDQKLSLKLDTGADADVQVAVKVKEAAGTVLFDNAKGRVHEITTRIVHDVEIESLGTMTMSQDWVMKVK